MLVQTAGPIKLGWEDRWGYKCPKCGMGGGGLPNKEYKCHQTEFVCDGIMERSINGYLYPHHGEFDNTCDCERCILYYRRGKPMDTSDVETMSVFARTLKTSGVNDWMDQMKVKFPQASTKKLTEVLAIRMSEAMADGAMHL